MKCPRSEQEHCAKELTPLLEGSSWVCYKAECNKQGKDEEFYRAPNGKLLTREEFFMQKEEFNG